MIGLEVDQGRSGSSSGASSIRSSRRGSRSRRSGAWWSPSRPSRCVPTNMSTRCGIASGRRGSSRPQGRCTRHARRSCCCTQPRPVPGSEPFLSRATRRRSHRVHRSHRGPDSGCRHRCCGRCTGWPRIRRSAARSCTGAGVGADRRRRRRRLDIEDSSVALARSSGPLFSWSRPNVRADDTGVVADVGSRVTGARAWHRPTDRLHDAVRAGSRSGCRTR